jgi:hypothetical protein
MIGAVFSVALLFAQAAPATTPDAPKPADSAMAATPASSPGPKVNKDGLICRTESLIGTRIPKRTCVTPEDAAARQQEDRRNIERLQSQFSGKPSG